MRFRILWLIAFALDLVHGQWTRVGLPSGGAVRALVHSGASVFAATGGGVYRTTDHAVSWTRVSAGLASDDVISLTLSGGTLLAGTAGEGLFKSSDGGASWTPANAGMNLTYVRALGTAGSAAFAFGDCFLDNDGPKGFFRSVDNGATWSPFMTGLPTWPQLFQATSGGFSLTAYGGFIFAALDSMGLYRAPPDGSGWTKVGTGLQGMKVHCLAGKGSRLFAGVVDSSSGWPFGRVYRSLDSGMTWSKVFEGPRSTGIKALGVNGPLLMAAVHGNDRDTGRGIFTSLDNGDTWTLRKDGAWANNVSALVDEGARMLAGNGIGGGAWIGTDDGATWTGAGVGLLTPLRVRSLAVKGKTLYAGTQGAVFRSIDSGATWSELKTGLDFSVFVSALAVTGNHVFAGTGGAGLLHSSDGGDTWPAADTAIASARVGVISLQGNDLYAGGGDLGEVYRTSNLGGTWQKAATNLSGHDFRSFAFAGSVLYAGTMTDGVYRSPDNGVTWSPTGAGLPSTYNGEPPDYEGVWTPSISVVDGTVFAGTSGYGMYRSSDAGATWTRMVPNTPGNLIYSQAYVGGNIYVGSSARIYVSKDKGATWSPWDEGLFGDGIWALAESGGVLYAGMVNDGLWRRALSDTATVGLRSGGQRAMRREPRKEGARRMGSRMGFGEAAVPGKAGESRDSQGRELPAFP